MSDSSFGLRINNVTTGGDLKEVKGKRDITLSRNVTENDGKDQIYVEANGKQYIIEGEKLNFDGLNKKGNIPVVNLQLGDALFEGKVTHTDNELNGRIEGFLADFHSLPGWGAPSQVKGTLLELNDLKGNNDGLWNNEVKSAGKTGGFDDTNPLILKAKESISGKGDLSEIISSLRNFRMDKEAGWGKPVSALDITSLKDGELFFVQKTIALEKMGRTPDDVTEGFVSAKGSVNGHQISDRELFWQRFKPVSEPNGKMVMIVPGFLQTGRNFYEQIDLLNKEGYDVMVMDQQWAGQTKGGKDGGVDRGYGITRDVAVMTSYAQEVLDEEYAGAEGKELILLGTSLGGGPGVIGALTMNENNLLNLEGFSMPKNVKAVLQGPFMGDTDSWNNSLFSGASHIPLVNNIPLPSTGLPILTTDKKAAQKIAQGAVLEDVNARLQAMTAMNKDIEEVLKMIDQGKGHKTNITVIHSKGDPLADSSKSIELGNKLPNVKTVILESNNHVLEQHDTEKKFAVDAIKSIVNR